MPAQLPALPPPPRAPLQATRHAACRLRVTVRREAGAVAQEGHKVLLAAVMVTHQV